jgi:hypothetical protein
MEGVSAYFIGGSQTVSVFAASGICEDGDLVIYCDEGSVIKNKLFPLDDDLISAYNDAIHSYEEVSYPAEGDNMEEAILLLRADKSCKRRKNEV